MNKQVPSLFLSYCHADEYWKDRLLQRFQSLCDTGRISVWQDRQIDAGAEWFPAIQRAMDQAAVAVCLVSEQFLTSRFCTRQEIPYLISRRAEDGLIVIPLLLRPCGWKALWWLKNIQMLPRDGRSIEMDYRGREDAALDELVHHVLPTLDNPRFRRRTQPSSEWPAPERVDITRLQTEYDLIGRRTELELLDQAWRAADTNLVCFVGGGGFGKSTLVNYWLDRMKSDNYCGARSVYGWSFYSQGTNSRVTSADAFFAHALGWFGDPEPAAGSAWSKGERLAALIQRGKTLLVLDGLEPIQSPIPGDDGRIKDGALETMLSDLAHHNPGLCVITTRVKPGTLAGFQTAIVHDIEEMLPDDGRALLRTRGVNGTDRELEDAVSRFGGHALALYLAAMYLRDVPGHPVQAAVDLPEVAISEQDGRHARRIMAAFAARFGDGPEIRLLRILGLFDRPAGLGLLAGVIADQSVPQLTSGVPAPETLGWHQLVKKLRRAGLVARENEKQPDLLDAHPLVRQHFGEDLHAADSAGWQQGHNCIYEYLTRTAPPKPQTFDEMSLLFDAMSHGCAAGRYSEVLKDVYDERVLQGYDYVSTDRLGAYGAGLGALSGFFRAAWEPVETLSPPQQAYVLHESAVHVFGGGQLAPVVEPFRRAVEIYDKENMLEWAAASARYLAEVHCLLGHLGDAIAWALKSVEFADRPNDRFLQHTHRFTLGDVLHQAGQFSKAEAAFVDGEKIRDEEGNPIPNRFFFWGIAWCDLLLTLGRYDEAKERALVALGQAAESRGSLLAIAQMHLAAGAAMTAELQQHPSRNAEPAAAHIQQALDYLQRATHQVHLPRGLLVRAALHRLRGNFPRAASDLDEVLRIAARSGMRLYVADCRLEFARLHIDEGYTGQARQSLAQAREIISATGYRRRESDLAALDAKLGPARGQSAPTQKS